MRQGLPDYLENKLGRIAAAPERMSLTKKIQRVNQLKIERNAVILAHNYQIPKIFHTVADIVGDSLALAREAEKIDADVIVVAGVHFMAETTKLLNPDKTVLIPDLKAGCSLAESITAENVMGLRKKYPGIPIITYVNTSAAVKAASDICCTSGNAKKVVEALGVPRVIMIPDEYLAKNVAKQTNVEILTWKGHCEVHERFTSREVKQLKAEYPEAAILVHPESPPEVIEAADFSGSTAEMSDFIKQKRSDEVILLTECSMSDNLAVVHPDIKFIRVCNLCPHMQCITLDNILTSLEENKYEITIDPSIADKARLSIKRMLEI
ncbi:MULTISPECIES: quinolinate synthase NadA [unclassified Commensalibacter]|uniref:quinolinate synthase NadA n=1 Tax=unclassified Commensalibacter TaxID=2630218 RepID=UPI0018DB5E03|nr:quinolinate synthase NadA [Commensalibacter sp. M0265]MBH9977849.1 quinolinate synthase NadA [Commensalibacter sp. M0266]MBH9993491.1 quinolinate synthase NadA [Commensalibacter sp. M0270]MBI0046987.1 quinolinate synthase NadA [Commensalibacter sp. M0267]MBI0056656.1 quinolinate synthase NadA [Commensalibacter sp. M0268]